MLVAPVIPTGVAPPSGEPSPFCTSLLSPQGFFWCLPSLSHCFCLPLAHVILVFGFKKRAASNLLPNELAFVSWPQFSITASQSVINHLSVNKAVNFVCFFFSLLPFLLSVLLLSENFKEKDG